MASSDNSAILPLLLTAGNPLHSLSAALFSRQPLTPSPAPAQSSPMVVVPFMLPYSSFALPASPPLQATAGLTANASGSGASVKAGGKVVSEGWKGGPAFVGQVFTMLDSSGNGLMAVTTRLEIPFLTKRTPKWLKDMFSAATQSEDNGPVFRFFMDLSDAVSYVKHLNVPTSTVGGCRLDVAYEHFKEKPQMFKFVPNKKQVIAANNLLRRAPQKNRRKKLEGVPVFAAQNLNIAIATNDGIRWYTPYFFDKALLDNILNSSVDQHFSTMIQTRHMQRRRDVIDDSLPAEMVEESMDSLFEPPEVQELLDEIGHSGIALSVISKAAEVQLLDIVDKFLLGNRWLRKATGIQPKFPYIVDSFEERTTVSLERTTALANDRADSSNSSGTCQDGKQLCNSDVRFSGNDRNLRKINFHFPCGNWLPNLLGREDKSRRLDDTCNELAQNPLLPKITMVGISTGESRCTNKTSLKQTMERLTKELEQVNEKSNTRGEDQDPLFVANVSDYSGFAKVNSS